MQNDKPIKDDNEFNFIAYEINRVLDLLADLPLDSFIKECYKKEESSELPFVIRETRVKAEKAVEFLLLTGKWVVDIDKDPDE